MNWKDVVNEGTIATALIVTILAIAFGADSLHDLAILLGGALAGTKVPKP